MKEKNYVQACHFQATGNQGKEKFLKEARETERARKRGGDRQYGEGEKIGEKSITNGVMSWLKKRDGLRKETKNKDMGKRKARRKGL